jgi:[acyl-carrier-protein] S-malonyltransferase
MHALKKLNAKKSPLHKEVSMGKIACLFPGQGSQAIGMGKDFQIEFPSVARLFDDIDQLAGRSLSKLCFEGPAEELRRTVNTQPTILAASLAAWTSYEANGGPAPDYVAGHSLGEFTALFAAQVLNLKSVIPLVQERAQLMEVCPTGAMSAVIGLPAETLTKLCQEVSDSRKADGHIVVIANFNTREQIVVSGHPDAVLDLGIAAKGAGGKVIPLPVGGAFHSPLMEDASSKFDAVIAKTNFEEARIPVLQNYSAKPSTSASVIKDAISKQMRNSVRWCESIEYMLAQGVDCFIEIGPGRALTGMIKKIDRSAKTFNIEDRTSLTETLAQLSTKASA